MLIGIVGELNSGRRTLAEYLQREKGFEVFNYADVLTFQPKRTTNEYMSKDYELQAVKCFIAKARLNWEKNYVILPLQHSCHIPLLRKWPNFVLVGVWSAFVIRLDRNIEDKWHDPEHIKNEMAFGNRETSKSDGKRENDDENKPIPINNSNRQNLLLIENGTDDLLIPAMRRIQFASISEILWFAYHDDKLKTVQDSSTSDLLKCIKLCDTVIYNNGPMYELYNKIEDFLKLAKELTRPHWDTYFMRMAFLVSSRSNCCKRRVGAVIVKDKRVVATGYNGTPIGVQNCNEGGCDRCHDASVREAEALGECLCIHAEANALLEAGRRMTKGSTLYATSLPCLFCTKLILQSGITRIVYNSPYDNADKVKNLFEKGNVSVVQYTHTNTPSLPLSWIGPFMPSEEESTV